MGVARKGGAVLDVKVTYKAVVKSDAVPSPGIGLSFPCPSPAGHVGVRVGLIRVAGLKVQCVFAGVSMHVS